MMLPLMKILCPTDFSDPSYEALHVADELATHFSAELLLTHVVSRVPVLASSEAAPSFNVGVYVQELEAHAKKTLEELIQDRISKNVNVLPMVVQGEPADEIIRIAEGEKVDVIVIATHGRTGWRRFIFGSVAEKVVRLSSCAVLTIHAPRDLEQ